MKRASILAVCVLSTSVNAAGFKLTWNQYGQPFGHNIVAYCGINKAAPYEVTSVAATETSATFSLSISPGDSVSCHVRALRLSDLAYSNPGPAVTYKAATGVTLPVTSAPKSTATTTTAPTTTTTAASGSAAPATTVVTSTAVPAPTPTASKPVVATNTVTGNAIPGITGIPLNRIAYGEEYYFRPVATDADGDALYFDITNRPVWAEFDSTTGELHGIRRMTPVGWSTRPASYDVGVTSGIVITVSDGKSVRSLPAFSIEVYDPNSVTTATASPSTSSGAGTTTTQTPPPPVQTVVVAPVTSTAPSTTSSTTSSTTAAPVATANAAPIITGTPALTARVGSGYLFIPYARDPDYDTLNFTIKNLPPWAEFNSASGELRGMRHMTAVGWIQRPNAGDAGVYPNIIISVTDGLKTTTLPPFTITVTD